MAKVQQSIKKIQGRNLSYNFKKAKKMEKTAAQRVIRNASRFGSITAAAAIAGGLFSGAFPVAGISSAILGAGASAYFFKRKVDAENAMLKHQRS